MIVDQVFTQAQAFGERLRDSSEPEGAKWTDQKVRNTLLAEQIAALAPQYGREMALCALRLEFRDHIEGEKSVKKWSSCNRRWCPVCAWRKSKMRYQSVLRNLPVILEANPSSRFAMWTFTVRNCSPDDLKATVKQMATAWNRLIARRTSPVTGYVRALELTFPRDGEVHPHYHVLVARDRKGRFPAHAELTQIWRECLGVEYDPVIECHMIRESVADGAIFKALGQVLKYSVKPMAELAFAPWAIPAIASLKGIRFVATGGILKEIFAVDPDIPEASAVSDRRFFTYRAAEREYRKEL